MKNHSTIFWYGCSRNYYHFQSQEHGALVPSLLRDSVVWSPNLYGRKWCPTKEEPYICMRRNQQMKMNIQALCFFK